jgi:hypothetical protein
MNVLLKNVSLVACNFFLVTIYWEIPYKNKTAICQVADKNFLNIKLTLTDLLVIDNYYIK